MVARTRKPSIRRQKIAIKKIASKEARQVYFSKRKAGLFKKANELSILCGAELAILVFSPAGKPYSFSHPSFNLISNRLLLGHADHHQASKLAITDQQGAENVLRDLSSRHEGCLQILEVERKRKVELDSFFKGTLFDDDNLDKIDFGSLEVMESKLFSMKMEFEMLIRSRSYHEHQQLGVFGNMTSSYGYDRGHHDLVMALPNDVLGDNGVSSCFPPPMYCDHNAWFWF